MIRRRGTASYAKCLWTFKRELYRRGYTNRRQFLRSAIPHVAVSLMPNRLRKFIYQKMLRKEVAV